MNIKTIILCLSLGLLLSSCMFMGGKTNLNSTELSTVIGEEFSSVESINNYSFNEDSKNEENIPNNFFEFYKTKENINSLVISKDGKSIFVSDELGSVYLYAFENERLKKRLILKGSLPILSMSLSPNQKYLAVAQFSSASVIDLARDEIIARQTQIKGRVKTISWDPHGEMLAFGLVSGGIYVWRAFDSSELEIYDAESVTSIVSIAFLPSAEAMFTASRQGEIRLWRLIKADEKLGFYDKNAVMDKERRATYFRDVTALNTEIEVIWINKNRLYAACSDGSIHLWKIRGLKYLGSFKADLRGVLSAAPISGSNYFVTSGREQNLKIWCPNKFKSDSNNFGKALKLINEEGQETTAASQSLVLIPQYQSGILNGTLNLIKIAGKEPVLWAYEKTGNLLRFNLGRFMSQFNSKECNEGR